MHYKYIKLNNKPIAIEYVEDEHEASRDFEPSFWWWNRRYYLSDFIRCHNNPWLGENYPAEIHAVECGNYYNPLFISLTEDGEGVYIYEEVMTR